jgi:low affinity Fe/Cu permease
MRRRFRVGFFERLAQRITRWTGSAAALGLAAATVIIWLISGPIFNYSDTWQLVINTGTTIVTFLMVFLIQRSQNKDSLAIQLKLNEIVAAVEGASNQMINVEDMSEEEILLLHQHFCTLAKLAKEDVELTSSHSVEEAKRRQHDKMEAEKPRRRRTSKA